MGTSRWRIALGLLAALTLSLSAAVAAPRVAVACTFGTCAATLKVVIEELGNYPLHGSGSVKSDDGHIDCEVDEGQLLAFSVCSYDYSYVNTTSFPVDLVLTAQADVGSEACESPTNTSCSNEGGQLQDIVSLAAPGGTNTTTTYTYDFPHVTRTLTVAVSGTGSGKITSQPIGIYCPELCSDDFEYNTTTTLTASPAAGSKFLAWTGACQDQAAVCGVHVTTNESTTAIFQLNPLPTPTATLGAGHTATPTTRPTNAPTTGPTGAPTAHLPTPGAGTPGAGTPGVGTAGGPTPAGPTSASSGGSTGEASFGTEGPIAAGAEATAIVTAEPAIGATSQTAPDLTPVVVAILVGFALLAAAVAFVGVRLTRRGGSGR